MIDLHTHVLPGIDDGPATVEGSIELARRAAADGTTLLVATPHVTWDLPMNDAARIAAAVEALEAELERAGRRDRAAHRAASWRSRAPTS